MRCVSSDYTRHQQEEQYRLLFPGCLGELFTYMSTCTSYVIIIVSLISGTRQLHACLCPLDGIRCMENVSIC